MNRLQHIENELFDLRVQLQNHKLYKNLSHIDDIKIFMENHVFCCLGFYVFIKSNTS